ncbi:MAG TPA: hypothetical protein DIT89_14500 [Planctomycetaceae bacterium]|nr:hypothetical protein [Planctomycetaceae bacterium]
MFTQCRSGWNLFRISSSGTVFHPCPRAAANACNSVSALSFSSDVGLFLQQAVIFGASSASVGEAFFLFWVAVAAGWVWVFFVFVC